MDFDFEIADLVKDGSPVIQWSQDLPSVQTGAPISFNDTTVGEVISKKLSTDGKRIFLTARLREDLQYRSAGED